MNSLSLYHEALKLMGNRFQLTAVADNEKAAREAIHAGITEIKRIEQLLTTFSEDSETARINQNAGVVPVRVSEEMIRIIERSIRISEITQGAFDITYGSVDKSLWNFDVHLRELPDKVKARRMARLINFRNILVNREDATVMLKEKGMRIGFGGIGKGYAAEMAKKVMREKGIESGIVNAAGDMTTWGVQPDGKPWTIGIADPNSKESIFSYMNITDMSVATSGNYEKYILIGGQKYSHTINPKTGLPIRGIKSVTIITPNAEVADAMATPVMIMGIVPGLNMINQIKDIEAIVFDDKDVVYTSKNIHFN